MLDFADRSTISRPELLKNIEVFGFQVKLVFDPDLELLALFVLGLCGAGRLRGGGG